MRLPSPVGIVGLGLMGGSLARALRELPERPSVVAWSRESDEVEAAREDGVVDVVAVDPIEVAGSAALLVYATPLQATVELIERHRSVWQVGTVVTDVASLKSPVVEAARRAGMADRFVGGHPMTGAAESGYGSSRPDLYQRARVWLVDDTGNESTRAAVEHLWKTLGAHPSWIGSTEHDERMVWASHLPQLMANALASVLEQKEISPADLGPGGRAMTRLSASSPEIWLDLLGSSGRRAAEAVASVARTLESLAASLERGRFDHIEDLMRATRAWQRGDGKNEEELP